MRHHVDTPLHVRMNVAHQSHCDLCNVRDSLIAFFDGINSRTGDMPFTKSHRATAAHFKHGSATLICVLLSMLFWS